MSPPGSANNMNNSKTKLVPNLDGSEMEDFEASRNSNISILPKIG